MKTLQLMQALNLFDLQRKLHRGEQLEVQQGAMQQLIAGTTTEQLQSILDAQLSIQLFELPGCDASLLNEMKVEFLHRLCGFSQISFQLEKISELFSTACQVELTPKALFIAVQLFAELSNKLNKIQTKHLQVLTKDQRLLHELAGQHYFGFNEKLVSKQPQAVPLAHRAANDAAVLVFDGQRYTISVNELRRGPKCCLIKAMRAAALFCSGQQMQQVTRLFSCLEVVAKQTYGYPGEYFADLEDLVNICLVGRASQVEIGRGIIAQLQQAEHERLKQLVAPLVTFEKLRQCFEGEARKLCIPFYTKELGGANFYDQFDFSEDLGKIFTDNTNKLDIKRNDQQQLAHALHYQIQHSHDCGGILYPRFREQALSQLDGIDYFKISVKHSQEYQLSKQLLQGYLHWQRLFQTHLLKVQLDFFQIEEQYSSRQQFITDFVQMVLPFIRYSIAKTPRENSGCEKYIRSEYKAPQKFKKQADWKNSFQTYLHIQKESLKLIFVLREKTVVDDKLIDTLFKNLLNPKQMHSLSELVQKDEQADILEFCNEYESLFKIVNGQNPKDGCYHFLSLVNRYQIVENNICKLLINEQVIQNNKILSKPSDLQVPIEFINQIQTQLNSDELSKQYSENIHVLALISEDGQFRRLFKLLRNIKVSEEKYIGEIQTNKQILIAATYHLTTDQINIVIQNYQKFDSCAILWFCLLQLLFHSEQVLPVLSVTIQDICASYLTSFDQLLKELLLEQLKSRKTKYCGQLIHKTKQQNQQLIDTLPIFQFLCELVADNSDILHEHIEYLGEALQVVQQLKSLDIALNININKLPYSQLVVSPDKVDDALDLLEFIVIPDQTLAYEKYLTTCKVLQKEGITFEEFAKLSKNLAKQLKAFWLENQLLQVTELTAIIDQVLCIPQQIKVIKYLGFQSILCVPLKFLVASTYNGRVQTQRENLVFKLLLIMRAQCETLRGFYELVTKLTFFDEGLASYATFNINGDSFDVNYIENRHVVPEFSINNVMYKVYQSPELAKQFTDNYCQQLDNLSTLGELGISDKEVFIPFYSQQFLDFALYFIQKCIQPVQVFNLLAQQSEKTIQLQLCPMYKVYANEPINFVQEITNRHCLKMKVSDFDAIINSIFERKLTPLFIGQLVSHTTYSLFATIFNLEKITFTTETLQILIMISRSAAKLAEKLLEVHNNHDDPGAIFRYCGLKGVSFAAVILNIFEVAKEATDVQLLQLLVMIRYCNSKQSLEKDFVTVQRLAECQSIGDFNLLIEQLISLQLASTKDDEARVEQFRQRRQVIQLVAPISKTEKTMIARAAMCGEGRVFEK